MERGGEYIHEVTKRCGVRSTECHVCENPFPDHFCVGTRGAVGSTLAFIAVGTQPKRHGYHGYQQSLFISRKFYI